MLLTPWGRVSCIDKTACFSVNCASLPSSLDGIRNRKARTGLVHQSSLIELHQQNQTRPNLVREASANQRLSTIEPINSDIDGERDITLHIKVSAPIRSRHLGTCCSSKHFVAPCSETRALVWLLFWL